MQLNIKALAITGAILWGGSVFIEVLIGGAWRVTIFCLNPEIAKFLASVYPGVTFTLKGAFIGLLYGLFDGGIFAGLFGWLYNYFSRRFS
jgi:hypothetical protein